MGGGVLWYVCVVCLVWCVTHVVCVICAACVCCACGACGAWCVFVCVCRGIVCLCKGVVRICLLGVSVGVCECLNLLNMNANRMRNIKGEKACMILMFNAKEQKPRVDQSGKLCMIPIFTIHVPTFFHHSQHEMFSVRQDVHQCCHEMIVFDVVFANTT